MLEVEVLTDEVVVDGVLDVDVAVPVEAGVDEVAGVVAAGVVVVVFGAL